MKVQKTNKNLKPILLGMVKRDGLPNVLRYIGGSNNLINLAYDGDIDKFLNETGTIRFTSNRMSMYLPDSLVQWLGFEDKSYRQNKEKVLGVFSYGKNGAKYRFDASLQRTVFGDGRVEWRVVGTSGSYGFGYGFLTKKETMGIRARTQIFKDIITKLKLETFVRE